MLEARARSIDPTVFGRYFPSMIAPIEMSRIPATTQGHIKKQVELYYTRDCILPELFVVDHPDREKTYVVVQERMNGVDVTHLLDTSSTETVRGTSSFWAYKGPEHVSPPYVGYTETYPDHRKQGLGKRRLVIMNAVAISLYDLPLSSANQVSDPERRIWERLVVEGKAKSYKDGEYNRYVFIP